MNLETFQKIIVDFQSQDLPSLTNRDLKISFIENMSLSIVGARRSGKTYRTYQFIKEKIQKGVKKEDFCRIQFNDHRLRRVMVEDLHLIDEAYYALYPEKRGKNEVYYIFDEIHRIDGWEDYVLYLLENQYHRVLITGSTSKLLKGEISSTLRGKNFSVSILPFSFREFIRYYNIPEDVISSKSQATLINMLQRYILQGGFPGLLNLKNSLQVELLQSYWDSMILRDIIEAHPKDNINIVSFTHFAQALISRISCPMTIRSITKNLADMSLKFSAETLYKYLRYLEEAFILFTVPIYSRSEKIRARNYQKVYAVDWALADAIAPGEGIDITRKFENIVFLELLRRGYNVSYYKTKQDYEIDFIATKKDLGKSLKILYQVCYDVSNKEVIKREIRGIEETARHFKIKKCYIITFNNSKTVNLGGVTIKIVPAWKWLLDET